MIESLNRNKCLGCGTCVEFCPMDVFRLEIGEGHAVIRYPEDCQTCYQCELECPAGAIRVNPLRKKIPQPLQMRGG